MSTSHGTDSAVLAADDQFYRAFETCDLDAMSDLWMHTDDVVCTHPGWPRMRGWAQIAGSWAHLFSNGDSLQFIVSDREVVRTGELAMVTLDENMLGERGPATVSTINVYRLVSEAWKMIAHHGSPVG